MTPADIERMAREAGLHQDGDHWFSDDSDSDVSTHVLTRFAALVRARALEDAARTIERTYGINAAAIRALGDTK